MYKIIVIAGWFLIFIVTPCGAAAAEREITVCGTGDSQVLLRQLATAFEKDHPGTRVKVPDSVGSSGGIRAVAAGKCDLGRTARPIRENEKKYELKQKIFAYSPVVFAANISSGSVDNLTSAQIVAVFSGSIKYWDELGGEKAKIYVVKREQDDSSRQILEGKIVGFKEIVNSVGKEFHSTTQAITSLKKYKQTIGYVPLAVVQDNDLTILKVDNVYPSPENVRNGAYVPVLPLAIVWKESLGGLAREFVDFLFSPAAMDIIMDNGAVPFL